MNTFLVTGAAGFIGSNIVEYLINQGHRVVGLDNLSNGKLSNLETIHQHAKHHNFTFIEGDIRNPETCFNACTDVDFVLHQAALGSVPRSIEQPLLYDENNVRGTLNMLIAARDNRVKRFVFASSSSVYGDTPTLPKIETMLPSPKSPYAISKITGEYYCSVFWNVYQLPTVALRYFNVFGPKQDPNSQYAAVVPKFATAFLSDESPVIYGDGGQTRDFTFIQNVIQANVNACYASEEAFGKAMNIGCRENISVNELAEQIKTLSGSTREVRYEPARAGDVRDSLADNSLALRLLKLENLILKDEGLRHTMAWYTANIARVTTQ